MKNMDWNSVESEWSYSRSQQSDHFIVFWAKGYGENKPSSQLVNSKYRVDIDDLLSKAEEYYKLNVDVLKFAILGNGSSKLEKYKLMIFLYYEDTWRATGLGYDDTIGALWISPATCHPVGTTVAHEIGHSFQYQVACDLGTGHGFRWGFSGNGAGNNGFWEQTAQWQAFNSYPNEFFGSWFSSYTQNYHKHLLHEDYRYNNCMIHQFWAQKRGIAFIGRIWRESKAYEDPIQTYQRLNGLTLEQLHDEMYEASTRFVTWDTDNLRTLGAKSIGSHRYKMNQMPDGSFQPDPSFCPQTTGYNVIPLEVPVGGTLVSADFQGIPNAPGYNPVDATVAGWRYGFVALLNDGSRVYSAKNSNKTGIATFVVPDNCSRLWFVVTGAPSKYDQHAWDSNNSNDMQWPYKVKFQNTNLPGYNNQLPKDVSFQYDISVSRSTSNYDYAAVNVDVVKLAAAFQMPKEEITKNMGTLIKFYAIEPNGSLNPTTTANGYGHWFDGAGKVTSFGANARVFSEFDAQNFRYKAGQYPGRLSSGDKFQMREMLIYTPPPEIKFLPVSLSILP
ncbi:DUF4859 domain-containing protein [Pedobacter sp. P26]|uniref:DUF4859 domain-containing protein n=1 Tax=Pedobacter sp. P26 TaxID=3423956 RepID=UPI003D67831A